jgi:hypothetical protein
VVASSAEEGPAAVAAAEVPRRRTAMPNSPEQVGAGEDAVQSRQEHAASGCGPGGEAEREAYLTAWHGPVYSKPVFFLNRVCIHRDYIPRLAKTP